MILYESISWKGPFSASIVSSLSQPGCLSKAAHLCHGFLHGHLGVVFFAFFALKSGNNRSWYSETHIYFLETLPRCLHLILGTWILSLQKRHGLLHFPQTPGLLPLQISELALEPPTSSEKPSCHHLMAWSKNSKSLKRSHTIKLWIICLSLLFRRHNPDKVFGWTWYCLPCLGFSLPAAGWKLGEIPSYLCFFACWGSHA